MQGFGPVVGPGFDRVFDHPWEARIFALWAVTAVERLGAGSGRIWRERLEPGAYLAASYYDRWQWSNEQRLLQAGTIEPGAVTEWEERLRRGEEAPSRSDAAQAERVRAAVLAGDGALAPVTGAGRFAPGDAVRVRRSRPSGHTRCPRYVRGAEGRVEAVRGLDALPDEGPERGRVEPVYAVSFHSEALFGAGDEPPWTVVLDLWETYLEAA